MGKKTGRLSVLMLISFLLLISSNAQTRPPNFREPHRTQSRNAPHETGVPPPRHPPPPSSPTPPKPGGRGAITYGGLVPGRPAVCNAGIKGQCGGKYNVGRRCDSYNRCTGS